MKTILKQIAVSFLALLVLVSTFSFTVESHFCGAFLVDMSFIGNADTCNDSPKDTATFKKCCSNKVQSIEGQDTLQVAQELKITLAPVLFFKTQLTPVYKTIIATKKANNYFNKPPPKRLKNYQVAYQSFLI